MTTIEVAIVHARKLRPRTKELYLQHVRAYIAFSGRESGWTARSVTAWRNDMRRRRIRPQSINVALNALRFAARKAALEFAEHVKTLPIRRRRESKTASGTDRVLTWAEGRALLDACIGTQGRDLRDHAIVTLGLRTGMLRFSMCQLRMKDCDLASVNCRQLTFTKKGGASHTILLDEVTADALQQWIDWLTRHTETTAEDHVFRSLGRQRVSVKDAISIGDYLTPDGLYRAIQLRAARAKLSSLSPHIFRKTFIDWAMRVGASREQIAVVTGHKSDAAHNEAANGLPANFLLPHPLPGSIP